MNGFDFTATARCEYCGNYMSNSDAQCEEHTPDDISLHFFRRFSTGQLYAVRATADYKWYKLHEKKKDDWIAWAYIGDRNRIHQIHSSNHRGSVEDSKQIEMSLDAPHDIPVN